MSSFKLEIRLKNFAEFHGGTSVSKFKQAETSPTKFSDEIRKLTCASSYPMIGTYLTPAEHMGTFYEQAFECQRSSHSITQLWRYDMST